MGCLARPGPIPRRVGISFDSSRIPPERSALSRRSATLWTIAGFALLLGFVYADPLFSGRNFVGRDLLAYNLPMESMIHDAYAQYRLPIWSPEISGGRPLLPNPNAGALYPMRMLLSTFSFPAAMRLYPVLHWFLAAAGCIFLLRTLKASAGAAIVGATAYCFSGVFVSEVFYPHMLAGTSLLPWILWASARSFRAEGSRTI